MKFTKSYTIGQVASRAKIASSTLRYYEKIGLLPAPRRQHGQRRYTESVFAPLSMIQMSKQLGFTLPEIKMLLEGISKGDTSTKNLQSLAKKKLKEVEETIQHAKSMSKFLRAISHCGCPSIEECFQVAKERLPDKLDNAQEQLKNQNAVWPKPRASK